MSSNPPRFYNRVALPLACEVSYESEFLSADVSRKVLDQVLEFERTVPLVMHDGLPPLGSNRKIMFMDQHLIDSNRLPSSVWGKTASWFDALKAVKNEIEVYTARAFNVAVCIIYPDGHSGVGYHSDLEAFGDTSCIPSLSLGAERTFCLREKATTKVYEQVLTNGSLLVMGKDCQRLYEHALPEDDTCEDLRVNITFRAFGL